VVKPTIHGEEAMLNVLLESKAPRSRRVRGTMASTLVHAAIIAGAVAVTVPKPGRANDGPDAESKIHYVDIRRQPPQPAIPTPPRSPSTAIAAPPLPGPVLKFNGPDVPPIHDVVVPATTATPEEFGNGGIQTGGPIGATPGIGSPIDGVVEERLVDRSPRLIGNPVPPVFPSALRYTGRGGRVLVEFVVDTTGRAEMNGFKVVQTADRLFAESVRAALPRYRFTPGEAGGRKVRTLVQLPFDFTLVP
jgi:protein TonB